MKQIALLTTCFLTTCFALCACNQTFEQKFDALELKLMRDVVKAELDAADKVSQGFVPKPGMGPTQALRAILGEAAAFEQWHYTRNGNNYLIFFSTRSGARKEDWQVIHKAKYPVGAVF